MEKSPGTEDIHIALESPGLADAPAAGVPGFDADGYELIGIQGAGDTSVYMQGRLITSLYVYANTDVTRELGGVLIGRVLSEDPASIVVEAAIEARYTEAVQTSVKFTHQSWEYINQVKDEKYPDKKIVGWFHTHPGFGIFLSGFDTFIHENFFNCPWQVAYVIDPLSAEDGFFQWKNGEIERCSGYYRKGEAVIPEPSVPDRFWEGGLVRQKGRLRYGFGLKDIIIIAQMLALAWLILIRFYPGIPRAIAKYIPDARSKTGQAHRVPGQISVPVPPQAASDRKSPPSTLAERGTGGEVPAISQASDPGKKEDGQPEEPKPAPQKPEPPGPQIIVVRRGESLWDISQRVYGDGHLYNLLAVHNRIKNPDHIYTGQVLEAPALPKEHNPKSPPYEGGARGG